MPRTLSEGPVRIMTYSPWRGDFASRSATVVALAGIVSTWVAGPVPDALVACSA
jgi:hypothetical protein